MLKTVRPPTDFIGPGVEVMVYSLAGDEVIKCKLHEQVTYTILASALLQRLSAQTNIPQKCFTLTINPTMKSRDGGDRIVVHYTVQVLEDEDIDKFDDYECCVCGNPCLNADQEAKLPITKETLYTNCVNCKPCYLCADCRVSIRGKNYCFRCIYPEDAEQVTEHQLKRMDYVIPEMAPEIRARKKALVKAIIP